MRTKNIKKANSHTIVLLYYIKTKITLSLAAIINKICDNHNVTELQM